MLDDLKRWKEGLRQYHCRIYINGNRWFAGCEREGDGNNIAALKTTIDVYASDNLRKGQMSDIRHY